MAAVEKIKLRFLPANDASQSFVVSGGYNSLLDLTLKITKSWGSVLTYLEGKWSGVPDLKSRMSVFFMDLKGKTSVNMLAAFATIPVGESLTLHPSMLQYETNGHDSNSIPTIEMLYLLQPCGTKNVMNSTFPDNSISVSTKKISRERNSKKRNSQTLSQPESLQDLQPLEHEDSLYQAMTSIEGLDVWSHSHTGVAHPQKLKSSNENGDDRVSHNKENRSSSSTSKPSKWQRLNEKSDDQPAPADVGAKEKSYRKVVSGYGQKGSKTSPATKHVTPKGTSKANQSTQRGSNTVQDEDPGSRTRGLNSCVDDDVREVMDWANEIGWHSNLGLSIPLVALNESNLLTEDHQSVQTHGDDNGTSCSSSRVSSGGRNGCRISGHGRFCSGGGDDDVTNVRESIVEDHYSGYHGTQTGNEDCPTMTQFSVLGAGGGRCGGGDEVADMYEPLLSPGYRADSDIVLCQLMSPGFGEGLSRLAGRRGEGSFYGGDLSDLDPAFQFSSMGIFSSSVQKKIIFGGGDCRDSGKDVDSAEADESDGGDDYYDGDDVDYGDDESDAGAEVDRTYIHRDGGLSCPSDAGKIRVSGGSSNSPDKKAPQESAIPQLDESVQSDALSAQLDALLESGCGAGMDECFTLSPGGNFTFSGNEGALGEGVDINDWSAGLVPRLGLHAGSNVANINTANDAANDAVSLNQECHTGKKASADSATTREPANPNQISQLQPCPQSHKSPSLLRLQTSPQSGYTKESRSALTPHSAATAPFPSSSTTPGSSTKSTSLVSTQTGQLPPRPTTMRIFEFIEQAHAQVKQSSEPPFSLRDNASGQAAVGVMDPMRPTSSTAVLQNPARINTGGGLEDHNTYRPSFENNNSAHRLRNDDHSISCSQGMLDPVIGHKESSAHSSSGSGLGSAVHSGVGSDGNTADGYAASSSDVDMNVEMMCGCGIGCGHGSCAHGLGRRMCARPQITAAAAAAASLGVAAAGAPHSFEDSKRERGCSNCDSSSRTVRTSSNNDSSSGTGTSSDSGSCIGSHGSCGISRGRGAAGRHHHIDGGAATTTGESTSSRGEMSKNRRRELQSRRQRSADRDRSYRALVHIVELLSNQVTETGSVALSLVSGGESDVTGGDDIRATKMVEVVTTTGATANANANANVFVADGEHDRAPTTCAPTTCARLISADGSDELAARKLHHLSAAVRCALAAAQSAIDAHYTSGHDLQKKKNEKSNVSTSSATESVSKVGRGSGVVAGAGEVAGHQLAHPAATVSISASAGTVITAHPTQAFLRTVAATLRDPLLSTGADTATSKSTSSAATYSAYSMHTYSIASPILRRDRNKRVQRVVQQLHFDCQLPAVSHTNSNCRSGGDGSSNHGGDNTATLAGASGGVGEVGSVKRGTGSSLLSLDHEDKNKEEANEDAADSQRTQPPMHTSGMSCETAVGSTPARSERLGDPVNSRHAAYVRRSRSLRRITPTFLAPLVHRALFAPGASTF